jgi:hypothetical protein
MLVIINVTDRKIPSEFLDYIYHRAIYEPIPSHARQRWVLDGHEEELPADITYPIDITPIAPFDLKVSSYFNLWLVSHEDSYQESYDVYLANNEHTAATMNKYLFAISISFGISSHTELIINKFLDLINTSG